MTRADDAGLAVVFDMDGVLIDSEPLWREAEIEVFGRLGVPLDETMCRDTMGLRLDEAVAHWHRRFPWREPELARVAEALLERVCEIVGERGAPMPGVEDALALFRGRGWPIAIASSSPRTLIEVSLHRLGIAGAFAALCSAADERAGKPAPDVYLSAARRLGVSPSRCLAIEDSAAGLSAALSAGMVTIAVPDPESFADPRFDRAHAKLRSLHEVDRAFLDSLSW